ncbi:MAG: hypothetical protein EAZ92_05485 [Candidatus Kapaibacterium sp.]|nr:MAG: hypothetical protein EAZ92_05485 [Candidatus Kapabacteria bacterium]
MQTSTMLFSFVQYVRVVVLGVCCATCFSYRASAQTPSGAEKPANQLEMLSLEDLLNVEIVTASRSSKQKTSNAPATVITITDDVIKVRGYQSLFDVIMDLPDFLVQTNSTPEYLHQFTLRGVQGMNNFILLLDGIKISSPTNELLPIMENYPVHLAKQIEIVYGPASALYGADAVTGVINIITKTPEDMNGKVLQATLMGGTHTYLNGSAFLSTRLSKDVSISVGAQYMFDQQPNLSQIEAYKKDFTGIDALKTGSFNTVFGPAKVTNPVKPEYSAPRTANNIYVGAQIDNFRLAFFRNYARVSQATAYTPNNAVYNDDVFMGHTITTMSGSYTKEFDSTFSSTTQFTLSRYDMDPLSNYRNVFTGMEPGYKYAFGSMLKAEQIFGYRPIRELSLTGGATFESFYSIPKGADLEKPVDETGAIQATLLGTRNARNPNGIAADFFTVKFSNIGGFLQGQYNPIEQLSFTLGARYDYNSRFGGAFNPRLGIVWRPSNSTTIKALYGSAFFAPAPYFSFQHFGSFFYDAARNQYGSFFWQLPNPALGPVRTQTAELSLRSFIVENFSVSLTGYFSALSGLVSDVPDRGTVNLYVERDAQGAIVPNGRNLYKGIPVGFIQTTINQGSQQNYGGTFQMDYFQNLGNNGTDRLVAFASVSYVEGNVDALGRGNAADILQIGNIAPLSARAGIDLTIGGFSISPRLIFVGTQRVAARQSEAAPTATDPNARRTLNTRQIMPGYALVNVSARYQITSNIAVFVNVWNATDARYRTINGSAAPEDALRGASGFEFFAGAPQQPIRVFGGLQIDF